MFCRDVVAENPLRTYHLLSAVALIRSFNGKPYQKGTRLVIQSQGGPAFANTRDSGCSI
jgi:hypothetical protein